MPRPMRQVRAAAQTQVNDLVAKALGAAKNLAAVTASTTTYSVWHETDPQDVWHASQGDCAAFPMTVLDCWP